VAAAYRAHREAVVAAVVAAAMPAHSAHRPTIAAEDRTELGECRLRHKQRGDRQ
jgi:hypothetical protein